VIKIIEPIRVKRMTATECSKAQCGATYQSSRSLIFLHIYCLKISYSVTYNVVFVCSEVQCPKLSCVILLNAKHCAFAFVPDATRQISAGSAGRQQQMKTPWLFFAAPKLLAIIVNVCGTCDFYESANRNK